MTTPKTSPPICERLALHTTWRDSHGELNDAPNEAKAIIDGLVEELQEDAKIFRHYGELHNGKDTEEGREKAQRNIAHAERIEAALASAGVK